MTTPSLESLLLAGIGIALVVLFSAALVHRPIVAVFPLIAAQVAVASSVATEVHIGGMNLEPGDLLSVTFVVATIARWHRRRTASVPNRQLTILFLIVVIAVLRGASEFGLDPSANLSREMLSLVTAGVYFSTVEVTPRLIRATRNCLLLASAVLVVVAVSFWTQHGFGTYAASGERALNGLQALIVLETIVFTVLFPPARGAIVRWGVPLFGLGIVVLSTQRTVWAATLVAAAVLMLARPYGRSSASVTATRIWVLIGALAVVVLVAAGPPGATRDFSAGYQHTSGENSTFSWRLEGWSILVERQLQGPVEDLAIGSPSGTGEDRVINGHTVTVAAHSMYVSAFDLTGILGLTVLVWANVSALRGCRRVLHQPSPFVGHAAVLFMTVLALQLTYFIGYSAGSLVGMMIGLACGFVRASSSRDDTGELAPRERGSVGARPVNPASPSRTGGVR